MCSRNLFMSNRRRCMWCRSQCWYSLNRGTIHARRKLCMYNRDTAMANTDVTAAATGATTKAMIIRIDIAIELPASMTHPGTRITGRIHGQTLAVNGLTVETIRRRFLAQRTFDTGVAPQT
jgi:hypothetical protein